MTTERDDLSERDALIYVIARASEDWDEEEIADAILAAGWVRPPC